MFSKPSFNDVSTRILLAQVTQIFQTDKQSTGGGSLLSQGVGACLWGEGKYDQVDLSLPLLTPLGFLVFHGFFLCFLFVLLFC